MKKFLPKYLISLFEQKNQLIYIIGFFSIGLILIISQFSQTPAEPIHQESATFDTLIPKGFVLVPIDLQNIDSVSAMIEDYAIVDLYSAALPGQKNGTKIGHRLRLLRAPLNPKTFAVLVPENEAQMIVASAGPLFAVLQNRDLKEQGRIEKTAKAISHVQYYSGGGK